MCNEKTKKDNKGTLALLLSILVVVLCLFVLLLWIFETIPHSVVTPDSFIGACITLLSIIVTIAIGWQIFNVVEVKNTMKEFKEKQEEVDELQKEIKAEITKIREDAEGMKQEIKNETMNVKEKIAGAENTTFYLHSLTLAIQASLLHNQGLIYYNYLQALAYVLLFHQPNQKEIEDCLVNMERCLKTNNETIKITSSNKKRVEIMDDHIRESKYYPWFETKYIRLMNEYFSRLVEEKDE